MRITCGKFIFVIILYCQILHLMLFAIAVACEWEGRIPNRSLIHCRRLGYYLLALIYLQISIALHINVGIFFIFVLQMPLVILRNAR